MRALTTPIAIAINSIIALTAAALPCAASREALPFQDMM
jgi:hypothetical protein